MSKVIIDNREYEADAQDNMLKTCLQLGFNLPYFCWHPSMGSVGACRQCAVRQFRDENDTQGQIVMACMTPAKDGTRISVHDYVASEFRARVIEWLMINHPHDCPVCEEGGECHLQDMTVMTGHTRRRYRGRKRTHRNQYLGPFINHEMNRCIACFRCTRFYRDYAGGDDLQAFGAHHHVYFGRHDDGALENEFSGNLVEVCPTGVFTDKTLGAHYVRKWDLQTAPGICHHCSLGCNVNPGERQGILRRIQNRYHYDINGYFLCDRGRFGAGFVNREDRPRTALLKTGGEQRLKPVPREQVLDELHTWLHDARGVIGIGSPRASLEGNYALRRLVGVDNFYTGMGGDEQRLVETALDILRQTPAHPVTLREAEDCDAVLVLGEDVTNYAPRLALSLRQSVRNAACDLADKQNIPRWHKAAVDEKAQDLKSPLFVATPAATRLDDVARATYRAAPSDIARLGFAVANELDQNSPAVADLDDETRTQVQDIALALKNARRPLVVAGTGLGDESVLQAAANVAMALTLIEKPAGIMLTLPECNSAGVAMFGGGDVDAALEKLAQGSTDTLIVLENDLYRRAPAKYVDAALANARRLIVIDHSVHATTARADALLPAGSFAETDGTLINNESRAQRFFQVYVPEEGSIQEGWRWCRDLMADRHSEAPDWPSLDSVITAITDERNDLAAIRDAAPAADFRLAGQRVPRATPRFSGRTAMHAHKSIHEPEPVPDPDSPLSYSMEGYQGPRPAALYGHFWSPGWNSNQQAITRFQDEVAGHLKGGDAGVRLIEAQGRMRYYDNIPGRRDDNTWLAVPLYHIFGSEPTSALAPAIGERIPKPYVAVHPDDLAALRHAEGSELILTLSGAHRRLPIRLEHSLARGTLGIPVGLESLEDVRLPQEVSL